MDDERDLLLRCLTIRRDHALGILEDLSEDQLRPPPLPTGWTRLGMITHLVLADQPYWFRCLMDGEPFDVRPPGRNAEWHLAVSEGPKKIFGLYRLEIATANG